jgi:hypothetical protein
LVTNSYDPQTVQVLVGWDADDPDTAAAARESTALDIITVRFPERFGYYQLHRYVNALAERANGDRLLLWNDDATLVTLEWDSVIGSHNHAACAQPVKHYLRPPIVLLPRYLPGAV